MYIMCYHIHEYILNWPWDQKIMFSWIYTELYVNCSVYVWIHTRAHTLKYLYIIISFFIHVACSSDIAQVIPTGSENNSHQAISNLPF